MGIGSSIFLVIPRVLGKLIDEHDQSKQKPDGGDQDVALKMAQFFKKEPWAIVGLVFVGAVAICARAYCMHTAGKCTIL